MDKKLQQQLYKKYPKIFRQKDGNMKDTCMCWGIATGNGWYDLIDNLCDKIQSTIDRDNLAPVEAVQVKEKFGGLRFYVGAADDIIYDYIYKAEKESYKICEGCGSKEDVIQTTGWIKTICKKCLGVKNEK